MTACCVCPYCGYQVRSPYAQTAVLGMEYHIAVKHPTTVTVPDDERYVVTPSGTKH